MSIDPYDPEPLYRQLAGVIRVQIESGKLARLDRLPSEQTLGQEYGVSRDTVREAMRVLRDEGLIFTLGQRGSYVGPRPS